MREKIIPAPLPNDTSEPPEEIFRALAKWERNILSHSPGHVALSRAFVEFLPGSISVLGKHIIIPLGEIMKIRRGDNFLWRGVVKVDLKADIDGRQCYIFFLGGKRQKFLSSCQDLGIPVA